MPARKRGRDEMEQPVSVEANPMLNRLRNTWYFANVFQFIQLFGPALNITEEFDIEDYEEECLKPGIPDRLTGITRTLLKYCVGKNERGSLDELARKTFIRGYGRGSERNPFGDNADEGREFETFDIFTKLRVMHDLTRWVFSDDKNGYENHTKFMKRMGDPDDKERISWRVEEFGWDAQDRAYFLLDDNRLYRRTPAPQPPEPSPSPVPAPKSSNKGRAKGKAKAKAKPAPKPRAQGTRRSARGRVESSEEREPDEEASDPPAENDADSNADSKLQATTSLRSVEDDGLGGDQWECLCITLKDYEDFLDSIRKSRDANEKMLSKRLTQHVLPVIQEHEDARARKVAKRQRELAVMQQMAGAKRSSRLAGKAEKEKEEQEAREAEEKQAKDLRDAQKYAERQRQIEEERESRVNTREQRRLEREHKQTLEEDALKRLEEEKEKLEKGELENKSKRQLDAELKKKQEQLAQLNGEEEEWYFDCAKCGVHGANFNDGKHQLQCGACNVWQHTACWGLSIKEAEAKDYEFICQGCQRKKDDKDKPKITLKFPAGTSSPSQAKASKEAHVNGNGQNGVQEDSGKPLQKPKRKASDVEGSNTKLPPMKKFKPTPPRQPTSSGQPNGASMHNAFLNGPTLSPQGQVQSPVNGNRPPGLVSPERPTHNPPPMQFGPPLPSSSNQLQPSVNGNSPQKQNAVPRTPGSADPFRNTFANQVSGSFSHRPSPGQGQVSNPQGAAQMPPPQTTPNSSFHGNGSFQQMAPVTPAQQPSVPQKQLSAAPSPAPTTNLQASSPAMAPTPRADAAAAGLSPVKNSPPRPMSREVNLTSEVPALAPSPKQAEQSKTTGAESPVKAAAPQPAPKV